MLVKVTFRWLAAIEKHAPPTQCQAEAEAEAEAARRQEDSTNTRLDQVKVVAHRKQRKKGGLAHALPPARKSFDLRLSKELRDGQTKEEKNHAAHGF